MATAEGICLYKALLATQGTWGLRTVWHGAGFARVRGISLWVITPLLAAVAMVMGHSTELYSPFQFYLLKKNSICVWSPRSPCRARGHTLWPLYVRLHGSLGPKHACC